MTPSSEPVRVWGIVPAAGMSRRMGAPKQVLPHQGSTMAATVVQTLLDAHVAGVVVVTRSKLVDAVALPDDERVCIAINDNPGSEMIDSIRIGLAQLMGEATSKTESPGAPRHADSEVRSETRDMVHPATPRGLKPAARRRDTMAHSDSGAIRPHSPFTIRHSAFDAAGVVVVPADMPSLSASACSRCIAAFVADPDRIVIATCAGKRGHPIIFPLGLRATVEGLRGGLRELPRKYPDRVQLVETDDVSVIRDVDTPEDYEALRGS